MQKLPLAYNHLSWKLLLEVRCDRQENLTVANYAVYTWVRSVWLAISSLMPCLHELLRTIHVANYSAVTQPCIVYHLYGVIRCYTQNLRRMIVEKQLTCRQAVMKMEGKGKTWAPRGQNYGAMAWMRMRNAITYWQQFTGEKCLIGRCATTWHC